MKYIQKLSSILIVLIVIAVGIFLLPSKASANDDKLGDVNSSNSLLVAQVGSVQYESLQEAVNNADGDFVKLLNDADEAVKVEGDLRLDLNGKQLSNLSVGGTLYCIDSTATATTAGTGAAKITGTVKRDHTANGVRYIVLEDSGIYTAHVLKLELSYVTFRIAAAGIYYKASVQCDSVLSATIDTYGVALSVNCMPGADFTEGVKYTRFEGAPVCGEIFTSGSVFGIFKEGMDNAARGTAKIYANAYIKLINGACLMSDLTTGDTVSDEGFDGVVWSLRDVLTYLNDTFDQLGVAEQTSLRAFVTTWKDVVFGWNLSNLHRHTEVVDAAVAPTCTQTGLTEGSHCAVCGEVIVAQTVVDALGHTEVIDAAVAPTCTTNGLTEGKHCSVCKAVLVAQTVVGSRHKYVNGVCEDCGDDIRVFAGGEGTESSPYLIATAKQLNNIRLYPSAYYELVKDIIFTSKDYTYSGSFYNSGKYWLPIDNFTGRLNGNNYSIDGLKINSSYSGELIDGAIRTSAAFGLFSTADGNISNLTLSNISITIYVSKYTSNSGSFSTSVAVGGIAGKSNGVITNCSVSGSISATGNTDLASASIGGIVGSASQHSTIDNCCNTATVKSNCTQSTYSYSGKYSASCSAVAGGIVGDFAGSNIDNCTNYGTVTANSIRNPRAGGIAGESGRALIDGNIDIQITNCYNYGAIVAYSSPPAKIDGSYSSYGYLCSYAGGIVAYMVETGVINCGNYADITAKGWDADAGGVVGNVYHNGSFVSQSFNKGNVLSYDTDTSSANSYGDHRAGGITASGGLIDQCYNIGVVTATGKDYVKAGGITTCTFEKISNCYNAGNVSASKDAYDSEVGGIIADCPAAIEYCYNVGELSGTKVAGIACVVYDGTSNSDNERHIMYCYYLNNVTKGVYQIVNSCTMYVYQNSDSALKQQSTFINYDFAEIWAISDDGYAYPQLKNNPHQP